MRTTFDELTRALNEVAKEVSEVENRSREITKVELQQELRVFLKRTEHPRNVRQH